MQMGNPFMGLPIFKNNNVKKHIILIFNRSIGKADR